MPEDKDKVNKIEDLKTKLFSRDFETKVVHHERFEEMSDVRVKDNWEDSGEVPLSKREQFFMQNSFFKKFFIFSIVFFVCAIGYAGLTFFFGQNTISNDNIKISIIGNSFTEGGKELPLLVEIENKNPSPLLVADLIIEYPKDAKGKTERVRQALGEIAPNSIRKENVNIVLFGEQGTLNNIKFELEYRIANSNAVLVKEEYFEVTINSTPINLVLDGPISASPNEELVLKAKISLNSDAPIKNVLIKADFPVGFQLASATPSPTFGNNVFALGDLPPGAEKEILIRGKLIDVFDGEEKTFRLWAGVQSGESKKEIEKVLNSISYNMLIRKSFVEARIKLSGVDQKEYAVQSKSTMNVSVDWVNNLDTKISDFQIRVKLSGNALDRKSIRPEQGFYDSATDEIIWDKNYLPKFRSIEPGESGNVNFTVASIPIFSPYDGLLQNPVINFASSISGSPAVEGGVNEVVQGGDFKTVKIITDLSLLVKTAFNSTVIKNSGQIPPKVGKETTYAVTWLISNSANPVSKAEIRAQIPAWIKWKGVVSPNTENVTFNENTREIIWQAGRINKGANLTQDPRQVTFQLGFTPSLSQVGDSPMLIDASVLTAHDDFANVDLRSSRGALTTRLNSDSAGAGTGGVVVE